MIRSRTMLVAATLLVSLFTMAHVADGAILVDINADGTTRDASVAEFEDAIGLAAGTFTGSSVTHINFNDATNVSPPTTTIRSGTADFITVSATSTITDYTIGGDADGWFGGGTSPNNLLEDGVFMRHTGQNPSGTLTLSGSGLGLAANTTYDLYLFAGRNFPAGGLVGHGTSFTFDVNDPTDPTSGTTLAAGVPVVGVDETLGTVQFNFTTGGVAPSQLVIGWDGLQNVDGNQDAVFSGFALRDIGAVPEPSTFGLAALGLLSLGMIGWRRRLFAPSTSEGTQPDRQPKARQMRLATISLCLGLGITIATMAAPACAATVGYWNTATGGSTLTDLAGGDHTLISGAGLSASAINVAPNPVPNPDAVTSGSAGSIYNVSATTAPRITDSAFEITTTSSFTFEGWLLRDITVDGSIAALEYIGGDRHGTTGFNGWHLILTTAGRLQIFSQGTTINSTTNVHDGSIGGGGVAINPHHFAAVWDHDDAGGTMRLYVDGNLEGSGSVTPVSYTGTFAIGGRETSGSPSFNDSFFEGRLDELRFSNEALSPSQFLNAVSAAVPEPSAFVLLSLGMLSLGFGRRMRRRR